MNQLGLDFITTPAPPTGRQLRDDGIRRSVEHAEAITPEWRALALGYVREYVCKHREFMCEDVRMYAEQNGLPGAPSRRAWGAVMLAAEKLNLIRNTGRTVKVKNPTAHCANAAVWQRSDW